MSRVGRMDWRALPGQLLSAFGDFFVRNGLTFAAATAFYTALALPPMLLLFGLFGAAFGHDFSNLLLNHTIHLLGAEAGEAVDSLIRDARLSQSTGGWTAAGVLFLLVSATGVLAELQNALNALWEGEAGANTAQPPFWWRLLRQRLFSLGMLAVLALLLVVSLLLSVALGAILPAATGWGGAAIQWVVAAVLFSAVFSLLYRFVPDHPPTWREALHGGGATAVFFLMGKAVLDLWLGTGGFAGRFGGASALAIVLLWFFYSASVVLLGAVITRKLSGKHAAVSATRVVEESKARARSREKQALAEQAPAKVAKSRKRSSRKQASRASPQVGKPAADKKKSRRRRNPPKKPKA